MFATAMSKLRKKSTILLIAAVYFLRCSFSFKDIIKATDEINNHLLAPKVIPVMPPTCVSNNAAEAWVWQSKRDAVYREETNVRR